MNHLKAPCKPGCKDRTAECKKTCVAWMIYEYEKIQRSNESAKINDSLFAGIDYFYERAMKYRKKKK